MIIPMREQLIKENDTIADNGNNETDNESEAKDNE